VVAPDQALHLTRPADLVVSDHHVSRQAVGIPGWAGVLGRSMTEIDIMNRQCLDRGWTVGV